MTYLEKKAIADTYLEKKAGTTWDNLPDINSLHNCDDEDDVIAMCDARLREEGFPFETDKDIENLDIDDDEDEGELDFIDL